MGQTLSEPITVKHTDSGANERFLFGVSEMQGWRIGMEDAHATLLQLADDDRNGFFAVYDGHGGASAAKFAGTNVHKRLTGEESYKSANFQKALKSSFLGTDEDLRADSNFFRDPSGCTAVASLLTGNKIFVANAGDSRAVLCVKGEAKPLSFDHKPQNEDEMARIKAAGGYVEFGRVNGNLALSRAIGDFEFKSNHALEPEKQIVTSDPEITEHEITEDDEFLVLACDGIWDCLTSQQVMDHVRRMVAQRKELSEICEAIMDTCLAPDSDINNGLGCDNMTVIVVALLHGRTKDQWYDWVAERVDSKYGYETPEAVPELYSPARVAAARERWANPQASRGGGGTFARGGFSALARVFGSNVTFHPAGGIGNDNLMFDQDDSSDGYESGEDSLDRDQASQAFWSTLQAHGASGLQELKDGDEDMDDIDTSVKHAGEDGDGDVDMTDNSQPSLSNSTIWSRRNGKAEGSSEPHPEPAIISPATPPTCVGTPLIRAPSSPPPEGSKAEIQGEAPPPPQLNGLPKSDVVEQLHSPPGGDAAEQAIKLEGLTDKSEDPLKSAGADISK